MQLNNLVLHRQKKYCYSIILYISFISMVHLQWQALVDITIIIFLKMTSTDRKHLFLQVSNWLQSMIPFLC
jgi:hypothetical protein